MTEIVFVDTSVLIYAHDSDAGSKREQAIEKLRTLWESGNGRLSVQVLQEFYVDATRKLTTPVALSIAREVVAAYGAWVREPTTPDTVVRATNLAEMSRISFWDALIVASAEQAGAAELLSEDLNPAQAFAGIRVVNPFLAPSP